MCVHDTSHAYILPQKHTNIRFFIDWEKSKYEKVIKIHEILIYPLK